MAESKSSFLSKSMQKHAGRAKEKLLQNLGKVDRTADEIFDEHLNNFTRQQTSANKLQKEFTNYIRCVRAIQIASKSLMDAICEIYEPQWRGYDTLLAQACNSEALWQDFSHKLGDQVLIPVNTYTAQFPEMKKKIEKRNRKLIDYDGQRHSFQNIQANASKRKDDIKLTKGREQLEEARRTYEILNTELHDELPALYDSRILFLVTNLQTLFASEQVFHNETSKIYAELEAIIDKLATDSQRGSYTQKKMSDNMNSINSIPASVKIRNEANNLYNNTLTSRILTNGENNINSPSTASSSTKSDNNNELTLQDSKENEDHVENENLKSTYQNDSLLLANEKIKSHDEELATSEKENKMQSPAIYANDENNGVPKETEHSNGKINKTENKNSDLVNTNKMEELYDIPVGATTVNLPAGVKYRVKATYGYMKEDADELSFEVGDIIQVIEYDDPEDQEEGWLMGEKEGTSEKGLFPANFTTPI